MACQTRSEDSRRRTPPGFHFAFKQVPQSHAKLGTSVSLGRTGRARWRRRYRFPLSCATGVGVVRISRISRAACVLVRRGSAIASRARIGGEDKATQAGNRKRLRLPGCVSEGLERPGLARNCEAGGAGTSGCGMVTGTTRGNEAVRWASSNRYEVNPRVWQ